MTPDFSDAVDPIFFAVLELLERIQRGRVSEAHEERERLLLWFREAEAELARRQQEWDLIKYALVSWIDDVLILQQPWSGQQWWETKALEHELFGSRDRATQFYVKAKEAASLTRRDPLEVFYVCAALGFRGFYRDRDRQQVAFIAESLDLPTTFEAWAEKTAGAIRWGYGRPPFDNHRRAVGDNAPLDGRFQLERNLMIGGVLAALVGAFVWIWLR